MSEFNDNKTEAPTPRRREKAREDGQVVLSADLTAGVLMLCLGAAARLFGGTWLKLVGVTFFQPLVRIHGSNWSSEHAMISLQWLATQLAIVAGVVVAGGWAVSAFTASLQAGFGFSTKPLEMKPDRLSPMKGWERIWSADGFMRGILSLTKTSAAVIMLGVFLWNGREQLTLQGHGSLVSALTYLGRQMSLLMILLALVALFFGGVDFLFRRFRHEQKLKMSRDEIKREHRESEGDPEAKQKIKKFAQEALQRKSLNDVPTATAVVTNPTHFAVAVRYDQGQQGAPRIVAKGADQFARQIIARAKGHGVPVMERKPVARALYALGEVGQEIPLALYQVVAEVLADVYRRRTEMSNAG